MTNSQNKARVSIGLPVFNGEKYLEETLETILAQTYTDFEVIIVDNCSTDRTVCCRSPAGGFSLTCGVVPRPSSASPS